MIALIWADILAGFAMYVMMPYLTNVWKLSTTHAAGIINIWNGITPVLAISFACVVDIFMGDFYMLLLSSIAYSVGLGLLSMSTPPVFGPCKDYKKECIGHTQKVMFYVALPLIAVGLAGHMVSLTPFLDLQTKNESKEKDEKKDENENKNEKEKKSSEENENKIFLQIPGVMMVLIVAIVGGIGLPYIKPWSLRFGIPAICSVVATVMFLSGRLKRLNYKHTKPEGSPLTVTIRVFVAAARNISRPVPDSKELNNEHDTPSTRSLRCFDKAAIKLPEGQQSNNWKVCNVREVEDTKIGVRLLPMWLTFIVIGIVLSIGNTYYLEQANHMDRKLGKIKVSIPIFLLFYTVTSNIFAEFYSFLTTLSKKYAPPIGIATGFFRHQTPESMRRYLAYCTKGVLGLGNMASVLSVYVVGKVSERNGKPNWFQYTLNKSRLDRYYWVLAGLSAVNLVIYVIVACFYKYKESLDDEDEEEVEGGEMNEDFQERKCCC
ncbi:hypothetical protein E3N88_35606 [Mikania micrantha]|uniref:Nodulin-like domain-containing protein n=1 Tax=Mikania micrantha TaxID=192012 RepID=A0A5N6M2B8_9ASTR|nr:hypothetical protein E3N88_35606 [Mikania micrantha]